MPRRRFWPEDFIIDLGDFNQGFVALEDTTKSPFGSFRVMRNAQVTDRGGIGPRPGTVLLGNNNTSLKPVVGFYNYKRSTETNELLVKAYDKSMEAFSKKHTSQGWFNIKSGLTTGSEMGFSNSLFNTSNENYLVGSNRYDPYFRWTGATAAISSTLVGGEVAVTVDSTLLTDIYDSQTASANSATTLDVPTAIWAASQWVNFYVYITSGTYAGQVRAITANTATQITFNTLAGAPGACTFQIRRLAFPASGTIVYGGTTVAYTAISNSTQFTVASAAAAAIGTVVTLVPENVIDAPRGNRISNYLGRMVVGNVRSALSRDSGGALQGYASGGTAFVSKLNDPFSFTFSGSRVAGEGDMVAMPYGGGDITDVVGQEDAAYVFKKDYIEALRYGQDASDLVQRDPLKSGYGSVGKSTKGVDDVYFFTNSNQLTSLGRIATKDVRPETLDIGHKIKRYLDRAVLTGAGRGKEIAGKIYFPIASSSASTANDVVLVYNRNTGSFEGIWDIAAFGIEQFNGEFYYASSVNANVYQLFGDRFADIEGSDTYPINFEVVSHFFNFATPPFGGGTSHSYVHSMHGMTIEGYIGGGTVITYKVWKDFAKSPSVTFTFSADETGHLDGSASNIFLGDTPLSLNNLSINYSDIDADGRRHFFARIYWPFLYANHFAVGISSSGIDYNHETTRLGLMFTQEPFSNINTVKQI